MSAICICYKYAARVNKCLEILRSVWPFFSNKQRNSVLNLRWNIRTIGSAWRVAKVQKGNAVLQVRKKTNWYALYCSIFFIVGTPFSWPRITYFDTKTTAFESLNVQKVTLCQSTELKWNLEVNDNFPNFRDCKYYQLLEHPKRRIAITNRFKLLVPVLIVWQGVSFRVELSIFRRTSSQI